ncbi:hypothetical protein [Bradyrhizobium sp. MOS002]|uniref:hypothetical protein n=1 Tax=Bradyrhizobium sp. MOS002 TaxID=2133947 RepID=UPI000D1315FE|nr:hypothetical protein [Bradyrhizobium sp. MOS002]PSO28807.1 hypothetical protein C7G41_24220 [Bradyrhizobium sp. MOS002]
MTAAERELEDHILRCINAVRVASVVIDSLLREQQCLLRREQGRMSMGILPELIETADFAFFEMKGDVLKLRELWEAAEAPESGLSNDRGQVEPA